MVDSSFYLLNASCIYNPIIVKIMIVNFSFFLECRTIYGVMICKLSP